MLDYIKCWITVTYFIMKKARSFIASKILIQHYVKDNKMIFIFLWKMVNSKFKGSYTTEEYKKENSS